jgi:uncharacterized protein (DUF2147 family)
MQVFYKLFGPLRQEIQALSAITLIAMSCSALAQTPLVTPVGLWRSVDDKTGQARAEIRIRASSAGVLSGVIEKSIIPSPEPICTECSDDRKGKPKLGLDIIRGAQKAEGKDVWEDGKILDPDNGRNYTLRLTPIEGGSKLEVRGSFGPFGRTQVWSRIQ